MHKVRYIDFADVQRKKEESRALDDTLVAQGRLEEVVAKNNLLGSLRISTEGLKMPFKRTKKLWK